MKEHPQKLQHRPAFWAFLEKLQSQRRNLLGSRSFWVQAVSHGSKNTDCCPRWSFIYLFRAFKTYKTQFKFLVPIATAVIEDELNFSPSMSPRKVESLEV
jgi:hypothetical protein